MTELSRRKLLGGLTAFLCAPAIVRVADLMPIKAWTEAGILPLTAGGTGATPIAARNTLLTPEIIAREALKCLERDVTKMFERELFGPHEPSQIRIGGLRSFA